MAMTRAFAAALFTGLFAFVVPRADAANIPTPADSGYESAKEKAVHEPLDALLKEVEHLHPVAMFFLAKRLEDDGRHEEALFWFYEGQLRWRSRVQASNDQMESAEFERLFSGIGPDINRFAGSHASLWLKAIDAALAWDAAHPDKFTPAGPAKDVTRKGLLDFKTYILSHKDEIAKKVADAESAAQAGDDPYGGRGGVLFGTPQEMLQPYDAHAFGVFRVGTTTKADVVKALGKPEMWFTDKGATTLDYSYMRTAPGMAKAGLMQRVFVAFKFDTKKLLQEIVLPKDK